MAKANQHRDVKPEKREPISLLRVEEFVERVPINAEQSQERLVAAGTMLVHAKELDLRVAGLRADLKAAVENAAGEHRKVEQIILDARNGTMAAPYPVIVERHPTHPLEMVTWRVPEGLLAQDILELEAIGEARLKAREDQGCLLLNTRAMNEAEIEEARRLAQPELPFEAGEATAVASDAPSAEVPAADAGTTQPSGEAAPGGAEDVPSNVTPIGDAMKDKDTDNQKPPSRRKRH